MYTAPKQRGDRFIQLRRPFVECSVCGGDNPAGNRLCDKCGTVLETTCIPATVPGGGPAEAAGNRHAGLVPLSVIGGVLLCAMMFCNLAVVENFMGMGAPVTGATPVLVSQASTIATTIIPTLAKTPLPIGVPTHMPGETSATSLTREPTASLTATALVHGHAAVAAAAPVETSTAHPPPMETSTPSTALPPAAMVASTPAIGPAETTYLASVDEAIQDYGLVVRVFNDLVAQSNGDSTVFQDSQWRDTMTLALAALKAQAAKARGLVAPPLFTDLHTELLYVADHMDRAADLMSGGIDHRDPDMLQQANNEFLLVGGGMERLSARVKQMKPP